MLKNQAVSLLGIPLGAGQAKAGVESAPKFLREAGLIQAIRRLGWAVEDGGDLPVTLGRGVADPASSEAFRHSSWIAQACQSTASSVARTLTEGKFALQIGGDHSIALGSVAGALRVFPDLRVIWVDAHGDCNTPASSPSGNFHGMPLAALIGAFGIRQAPGFGWLGPELQPGRVALVGVRDLDPGEKDLLRSLGIVHYGMQQVKSQGISSVMEECLDGLGGGSGAPIHYSLDIDALDPKVAGATGVPVEGGLGLADIEAIGHQLAATRRLVSMDLVEINPLCGSPALRDATLQSGIRAVLASLERSARYEKAS